MTNWTITDPGANEVLGVGDERVLVTQNYSDGNTTLVVYTNPTPLVALGNTIRFAYTAVSTATGNQSVPRPPAER